MVFSTISAYLDPANYWQQSPNYQSGSNIPLPPPQQSIPLPQPHGAGGAGSIRTGSMADRAQMSNISMPETAQKCPRCESTNTKFCYFNNYSLSQPRHFCKTCRRYWTSGGALRNVPVGGGYRRNKRNNKASSSNISKSESAHSETASVSTSSNLHSNPTGATGASSILGGLTSQFPQLRFTTPMSHHNDHYGGSALGMNYSGISTPAGITREMNFPIDSSNLFVAGGGVAPVLPSGGRLEQWRMQQQLGDRFPNFLGGFDPTGATTQGTMLYGNNNYQSGGFEIGLGGYAGSKFSNDSVLSQSVSSPKMEGNNNNDIVNKNNQYDNSHESNMGTQFLGYYSSTGHWNASTTALTNLSGFSNAL